jgi:hypothetical protein
MLYFRLCYSGMEFLHTIFFPSVSNVELVVSRLAHQYEVFKFRSHFFAIKILKLTACRSSYYDETDTLLRCCENMVETIKLIIFVQHSRYHAPEQWN